MSANKLLKINEALAERKFEKGLSSITQANCQVTLTDKGYRIYRPPNITYSSSDSSTRTMWGGLIIQPFTGDSNFLIKTHTYIILFHVEGKSSNNASHIYWSNNAGWTGGAYGLTTSPTNVSYNTIGENFNGEKDMYYKFTVADDINKKCTTSYSSFTAGTTYNCYRDFKWGFEYTNTGAMGTDLYLTNFRMYDITTPNNVISVEKDGIVKASDFSDGCLDAKFYDGGEVQTTEFIEY